MRALLVVVVLALAAMWIYVWSGAARRDHPDRLADPSFAAAAGPVCAEARQQVDALPRAADAATSVERADVVDEANLLLRTMVAELRSLMPPDGEDGRIIDEWLADWSIYIADRQAWADGLRAGRDEPFFETEKGGGPISELMDTFARVNDIEECQTPDDV